MKKLFFASIIIFFTSCGKMELDLSGLEDINWGSWGYFPVRDSSDMIKATIDSSGKIFQLSAAAYSTAFTKYSPGNNSDSSILIYAYAENMMLQLDLLNIMHPGIYKFGKNASINQELTATCYLKDTSFLNNPNMLSGTLTIDSLTTKKIQGSFSVKCWNGTNSINITNGSFVGKF